jgi:septal ring factor EnvC (AmiA/AmiB activator)
MLLARCSFRYIRMQSSSVVVPPPSSPLVLGVDATLLAVTASILGTLLAASISWAFGRNVKAVDQRIDKLEDAVTENDHRQRNLELHVATNYLRIDDHIRAVNAYDSKMDSLIRKIDHLMEKLNAD